MTEMTIQVPAELAERLRPYQNRIQELLEQGMRVLESTHQQADQELAMIGTLDDPLEAETKAFLAMHSELVKTYLGEHVAIYQGELIDHDLDVVVLMLRVREAYGEESILLREVEIEPDRPFRIPPYRSYRLL